MVQEEHTLGRYRGDADKTNRLGQLDKKENYQKLWQRVNSLWYAYCEDLPNAECHPRC